MTNSTVIKISAIREKGSDTFLPPLKKQRRECYEMFNLKKTER